MRVRKDIKNFHKSQCNNDDDSHGYQDLYCKRKVNDGKGGEETLLHNPENYMKKFGSLGKLSFSDMYRGNEHLIECFSCS